MVLRVSRRVCAASFVAVLCASAQASAQSAPVQLSAGLRQGPIRIAGTAGGPVDGSRLGPECRGHFPAQPQHQVVLSSALQFLQVFTNAAETADVTLAVVGPGGVRCDDDSGGQNQAKITGNFLPGTYNIFIGSYRPEERPTYDVVFSTNPATDSSNYRASVVTPPPNGTNVVIQHNGTQVNNGTSPWNSNATPTPNPNNNHPTPPANRRIDQLAQLAPSGGVLRVSVRRPNTIRARGRTGGAISAAAVQGGCAGYVFEAPTYNLQLDATAPQLRFLVTSAADTTLMVRSPDGNVSCADDISYPSNTHPLIELNNATAGTYSIWVGIFRENSRNLFQLTATTTSMRLQ